MSYIYHTLSLPKNYTAEGLSTSGRSVLTAEGLGYNFLNRSSYINTGLRDTIFNCQKYYTRTKYKFTPMPSTEKEYYLLNTLTPWDCFILTFTPTYICLWTGSRYNNARTFIYYNTFTDAINNYANQWLYAETKVEKNPDGTSTNTLNLYDKNHKLLGTGTNSSSVVGPFNNTYVVYGANGSWDTHVGSICTIDFKETVIMCDGKWMQPWLK